MRDELNSTERSGNTATLALFGHASFAVIKDGELLVSTRGAAYYNDIECDACGLEGGIAQWVQSIGIADA